MDKMLVSRKEASEMLSISVKTLDVLRRKRIPCVYIGCRVYFRPEDLKTFVDKEIGKC